MRSIIRRLLLRLRRRRLQLRALVKSRELDPIIDRTDQIEKSDIILVCTLRNERPMLPYFFDYYRKIGVGHFLFIDNGSTDGTTDFLTNQRDCSVWGSKASYKKSRFGMDWVNHILARHAQDHWVLTVDADEFFVYPHSDVRPLRALTDWLDNSSIKSFGALLLDMYSEKPIEETEYTPGTNPFDSLCWFDSGNYTIRKNALFGNLWIQGGPRMRAFFADRPNQAPALNKTPLVRWKRGYVYYSSTHSLLPRGLNRVYDEWGGEKASGCLLHAKFSHLLKGKALEELDRRQHYAASREYRAYRDGMDRGTVLWTEESVRYVGWRQLEGLGLMSTGGWI
jgi:hypothetical protein